MKFKLPIRMPKITFPKLSKKIVREALSIAFVAWLPLAFVTTAVFLLAFVLVQQTNRQLAYDPQIQLAEDIAGSIEAGNSPAAYAQGPKVELAQSLAPYLIIYDDAGKSLSSSVTISGQVPTIPTGVFNNVRKVGEERVTWQPAPNIRGAIVVKRYNTPQGAGFVVIGRSLRETETRVENLLKLTAAALVLTLAGLFGLLLALEPLQRLLPIRHSH